MGKIQRGIACPCIPSGEKGLSKTRADRRKNGKEGENGKTKFSRYSETRIYFPSLPKMGQERNILSNWTVKKYSVLAIPTQSIIHRPPTWDYVVHVISREMRSRARGDGKAFL